MRHWENIYVAALLQTKANFHHFWPTSALAVRAFFKKCIVNVKASPLVQLRIFFARNILQQVFLQPAMCPTPVCKVL